MIKIAVASENEKVTEHFGHCINFNIFEVEDNRIVKQYSVENPGHKPGFLPNYHNWDKHYRQGSGPSHF